MSVGGKGSYGVKKRIRSKRAKVEKRIRWEERKERVGKKKMEEGG